MVITLRRMRIPVTEQTLGIWRNHACFVCDRSGLRVARCLSGRPVRAGGRNRRRCRLHGLGRPDDLEQDLAEELLPLHLPGAAQASGHEPEPVPQRGLPLQLLGLSG